jgi:anti-anti-sigma factor
MLTSKNLEWHIDLAGDVPIIVLSGDITSSAIDVMVLVARQALDCPGSLVGIELAGSDYINSSGLAVLIRLIKTLRDAGRRPVFVALSGYFIEVMKIVGVFEIASRVESRDALKDM